MDPFMVLDQLEQVIARAYTRVSKDRSGRSRSTGQQDDDLSGDCERRGWVKGESYSDNSKSASRYSRDERGDFEQLIADLEHDRFGGHVLLLWESSRGSRRVGEWVRLIDLCEQRGVYFWVHTHSRVYDPANPRDRRTLLEDAVDSEYESGKTSSRIKRDVAASAVQGRPHGRCPYGYRRVYDPHTRKLIGQEPDPDEAVYVEELFTRVLAGHSVYTIAREWDDRGVRTRSGLRWRAEHLRPMLLRPCYAGLRAHVPGRTHGGGSRVVTEAQLYPARWKGLVSVADWHTVQRRMRDPERGKVVRPGKAKYLLSVIARCGVCEGAMSVGYRSRGAEYGCHERGCVRVLLADLDTYIEGVLFEHLSRPAVIEDIRRREEAGTGEVSSLRDDLARLQAVNEELADALSSGQLSVTLAAATERKNLEKIGKLEVRIKELTVASPVHGLIEPGVDVRQRWDAAPISARREIVRALFTAEGLGQIRVVRAPERRGPGRVPAVERVRFRRSTDPDAGALGTAAAS
jgi:site-specific DNA recombinase